MSSAVLNTLGGLGLFLLGMKLMTEGLRMLAGGRMERWLARATRTPLSGAVTGMVVTAVIRSSSATTVAAVGFVGAGLMTFEQSLGVIFGSNIGTTLTGWIVALLGFKIQLGSISQGLVFAGALMMLLGRGAWAKSGRVLVGFALLFIGLELVKSGLSGAADGLSLERFQSQTIGGRLILVGFGVLFTLVTQSSGATVAMALAALAAGIIDLPQSLAVVIGADFGTTATAWLASLGGTADSRRTGLSHVIYNLITAFVAFLILPLYYSLILRADPDFSVTTAQFAMVAFHSLFNILGVVLILPFTRQFARMMCWLVKDRMPSPAATLDKRLLQTPAVAIETLFHATVGTATLGLEFLESSLQIPPQPVEKERLDFLERNARDCRVFAGNLAPNNREPMVQQRVTTILHALDHIDRLIERCRDTARIRHLSAIAALADEAHQVREACGMLRRALIAKGETSRPRKLLESLAQSLESDHQAVRHQFIQAAARGVCDADEMDQILGSQRWLRRVTWHAFRICHYLSETGQPTYSGSE